ncbi:hypothetical protein K1T71_001165 [Dendrolimus kikuchii]|uniref:Uncharacterized protein n=1 Tax=Dendrolimus kikuchii TaxID=765133 RepID=A0ACC1DHF4_9NEOP|nr:hypothetical protein K1T71_001165 [Dendrolimus kikuchii]
MRVPEREMRRSNSFEKGIKFFSNEKVNFEALICSEARSLTLRHQRQATNFNNDLGDSKGLDKSQFPFSLPRPQPPQQSTTTTTPLASTTSAAFNACLRNCLVTTEYNPVCGSNNVTYDNLGRFTCAQRCGACNSDRLTLQRGGKCLRPSS